MESAVLGVPELCADAIINLYQGFMFSGHQRITQINLTISYRFYISNLMHNLRAFISSCHFCEISKNIQPPKTSLKR